MQGLCRAGARAERLGDAKVRLTVCSQVCPPFAVRLTGFSRVGYPFLFWSAIASEPLRTATRTCGSRCAGWRSFGSQHVSRCRWRALRASALCCCFKHLCAALARDARGFSLIGYLMLVCSHGRAAYAHASCVWLSSCGLAQRFKSRHDGRSKWRLLLTALR